MATDSTELTFVRCPSCRSLVPAAHTRCKMCGASLDGSAKLDESDKDPNRSQRVRQRTMSQPKSDLNAAASQLRKDSASASEKPADKPMEKSPEVSIDDPLSSYVEEVDDDLTADSADEIEANAKPQVSAEAQTEEPEPIHQPEVVTRVESHSRPEPRHEPKSETPVREQKAYNERRPGQKPGGLSFGGGRQDRERDQRQETPKPAGENNWSTASNIKQDKQQERRHEAPRPEIRREVHSRPEPQHRPEQTQFDNSETKAQPGRLAGWLVSYAKNSNGSELRLSEGKFFVTRSGLKQNDLVIDEPSISVPHAMVEINGKEGLFVQNLISDKGVFVKKAGAQSFEKVERVKVGHGDSIRFGDVEFLVCLVPSK